MTQVAATSPGAMALHKSGNAQPPRRRFLRRFLALFLSRGLNRFLVPCTAAGFVRALIAELWSALECGSEDAGVVRPKATPVEPIDRSCLKVPRLSWNLNNSLLEAIFFFFNQWI